MKYDLLINGLNTSISTENNTTITRCPKIISSTVELNCLFENSTVSCNKPVLDGTIATLKCKKHYYIPSIPYNEIYCEKGQWNLPPFICELIKCSELFSTSLSIHCLFENKTTSCDEPMFNGTTALLNCKNHYYIEMLPYSEILCMNGQWNLPLFNCEPVCGVRTPKGTPLVVKGSTAEVGDFPWHVGLYEKITWNTRRYICGGSIISPKLVLTAAHCFLSTEPIRYDVTAGKFYREWNNTENDHAQYRDIIEIIMSEEYNGELTSYTADIAILVVDRVFILSDLVLPACMDYSLTSSQTVTDIVGEVPGWGLTSEGGELSDVLQYTKLPLISREQCLNSVPDDFTLFVTLDKICAGYTNGTSACEGDSGGGLVHKIKINNSEIKYYLIGIVSTSPFKENTCDSYQYSTFTNVAKHIAWVNETIFKYESWSPFDYGCSLPDPSSFGNYTIFTNNSDSKDPVPGSIVPHYTKLKYSCDEHYEIYGPEIITCKDKKWNDNIVFPACYRTCSDLVPEEFVSSAIYIRYSLEKKNSGFLHETQAYFNCIDKKNYELEKPGYNQTTCRDGKWIKPLLKCVPICGTNTVQNEIEFDEDSVEDAYAGKYPWHAAVYKKVGNNYTFECTASIISVFVLISHKYNRLEDSAENYVVVMGNINFTVDVNNKNIQMSPVFKIVKIQETIHYGFYTTLIILKNRINITSFVRPVCLDKKYLFYTQGYVEIPLWMEGNDTLKNLKLSHDVCNEIGCGTNIINATEINVTLGQLVRPVKIRSSTKYYILSEISNRLDDEIFIQIFNNVEFDLILKNLEIYNIQSFEMSECIVPNISTHGHFVDYSLKVGEAVLETTRITFVCDLEHYDFYNSKEMICKSSSWVSLDGVPPTCIECGKSELEIVLNDQISSTKNILAQPKEFPWHVGIYDIRKKTPQLICAGTILSSKIVLGVSLCFPGGKTYSKKDKFAIGAGKMYDDWDNALDVHAQYINIENVTYFGDFDMFAVILLSKHLQINNFVSPVCLIVPQHPRNLTIPLVLPSWTDSLGNEKETTNMKLRYMKLNISDERLVIKNDPSMYCPNNKYWETVAGSASVQLLPNEDKRYFLHSLFLEVNCDSQNYVFGSTIQHVKILKLYIKRYSK